MRATFAAICAVAMLAGGLFVSGSATADPAEMFQSVPSGRYPIDLDTSPDGAHLAVISRGDGGTADLRIYETVGMTQVSQIDFGPAASFNPTAVEFSPDGAQLWVSFYTPGEVRVYDAAAVIAGTPTVPVVLTGGGGFVDLAAGAAGRYMYAATLFNPQYQFSIANPAATPRTFSAPSGSRGVASNSDGSQIFFTVASRAVDGGGVLAVSVAADGTLTPDATVTPTGDVPWGVAFSAAEGRVVSSNSGTPTSVSGFNPGDPSSVRTVALPCGPRLLNASPSGTRIFVACLTGGIAVVNYVTNSVPLFDAGGNIESVETYGPVGGDSQRVYATSGATDEVLVFTKPTIAPIPAQTVREGGSVTFSTTVKDFWQTLQWQSSSDGGSTWTDIAAADRESLTVDAPLSANGMQYRLVARSAFFDDVVSSPIVLTVTPTPVPPMPANPALAATGVELPSGMLLGVALMVLGFAALTIRSRRRAS